MTMPSLTRVPNCQVRCNSCLCVQVFSIWELSGKSANRVTKSFLQFEGNTLSNFHGHQRFGASQKSFDLWTRRCSLYCLGNCSLPFPLPQLTNFNAFHAECATMEECVRGKTRDGTTVRTAGKGGWASELHEGQPELGMAGKESQEVQVRKQRESNGKQRNRMNPFKS